MSSISQEKDPLSDSWTQNDSDSTGDTTKYTLDELLGLPWGSDSKESAHDAGDLGLIPGLGRSPGGGHGNPLQYSCLENPQGQRGLVGYSPWGRKELDTTERLSTHELLG